VVGALQPQAVGEAFLKRLGCTGRVPSLPAPIAEMGPGDKGVGVVGALHPQAVGEQFLEYLGCTSGIPRTTARMGAFASGGEGAEVVSASHLQVEGEQFLELLGFLERRGCAGEAVLQARVAELVDRPNGAQDAAFVGIVKEPHEANRGASAHGKLNKRERGWPGCGAREPG
jgi:hypothetical protein